jgi:hypothetical protein
MKKFIFPLLLQLAALGMAQETETIHFVPYISFECEAQLNTTEFATTMD